MAEALVQRLNKRTTGEPWVVVGRELLSEVAKLSGYSVAQIEKSQDTPSSLKAIFPMFLDNSRAEETEVFTHLRNVIRGFAKRGHCVLVGGGAVLATQDLANCIHLRLFAPYDFRVRKIVQGHHLTQAEAEKFIDLHQKQRDDFLERFADEKIDDPLLYHLLINNSRMQVAAIAELADDYLLQLKS
ncbi:MAG: cytidylate kinase-like family protein [Deltaproteobacteria bacterium]|nr:cytidylate kinase-like family protein [Deltaproteobacteria bacterium]